MIEEVPQLPLFNGAVKICMITVLAFLGVAAGSSGYSIINLYNRSGNNSQKSISFASGQVNSVKIIGSKVKVSCKGGKEETRDVI